MEITFRNRKLAKTFNSADALQKAYGPRMVRTIMTRLAVLQAAPTLSMVPTVPPNRRHQLHGNRAGQFAVDLVHPHRLVFSPNHDPIPVKADGGTDTDQVTAITVIEIVDYH